jgi:hypothetical protein
LISRILAAKSPDRIFTPGFVLVGLATLAQASCLMLEETGWLPSPFVALVK